MLIFAPDYRNIMERNLLIELLEDGEKVSLYSPHFEGEEYSEFEKFLLAYKDDYPDVKGAMEGVCAGIQNMLLTAYSKGIGSCWMTAPNQAGMDAEMVRPTRRPR